MNNSNSKPVFVNTEMSVAIQSALKAGDRAKRAKHAARADAF